LIISANGSHIKQVALLGCIDCADRAAREAASQHFVNLFKGLARYSENGSHSIKGRLLGCIDCADRAAREAASRTCREFVQLGGFQRFELLKRTCTVLM